MHRRVQIAALLAVLLVGISYVAIYCEVYPGPQVLSVYLGGMSVGPSAGSEIVGQVVGFDSQGADLLQVSLSTVGPSATYLLNSAQLESYYASCTSATTRWLGARSNATEVDYESLPPTGYPSNSLYSSQFSGEHSVYLNVQKQTWYYLAELSASNANFLSMTAGQPDGYDSLG